MNVIAVDDEFHLKLVYEYMFKNMFGDDINFKFYDNPLNFLDDVPSISGDVIVMTDINMPQINGFELCAKLKELKPNWSLFLVSARDPIEYLSRAKELNVSGFFVKPLDFDEVHKGLEKFL